MTEVYLKNIFKNYGSTEVVKGIDLLIEDNDFVVLVGPSGCGKSTTLRMISGLEEITSGEMIMDHKVMNHVRPSERNVAMVFQDYALYPHMNVYDNMAFSLKIKKFPEDEIKKKVHDAAKMLDLEDYLKRKPAELSGGQRQRVAMGRAIVKNVDLFLFDEPLSNLDAKLRSKMRREIKQFHKDHQITTIYVTHDQLEAMTLANKLVVMNKGKIEQIGAPLEVYENPKSVFVAEFIGSPGMNILSVNVLEEEGKIFLFHQENGFKFPLTDDKAKYLKDYIGQDVLMGIRPSDICLSNQDLGEDPWIVESRVEMIELIGKNAFVTLKCGKDELIGEIIGSDTDRLESHGIVASFYFNLNYIHLFDKKTQLNLVQF